MDEYAKLLTSVAALFGALAWPGAFLVAVFFYKGELKSALNKIPVILDRVKKASLAGIALELDRVADAEAKEDTDKTGKITAQQVEAAAALFAEGATDDHSAHACGGNREQYGEGQQDA